MLEKVKLAMRISTTAFDQELTDLIESAKADLGVAGVTEDSESDPLIRRAIITFCRLNFGTPDDYDRLKKSYDEQKAQLSMHIGYTDFGGE